MTLSLWHPCTLSMLCLAAATMGTAQGFSLSHAKSVRCVERSITPSDAFQSPTCRTSRRSMSTSTFTQLSMSLKPAAIPLMDSGKALARTGELLIDVTTALDLYGGGLSAAGAEMRNAGDSVAQAAASARFKTGTELVIDELRESGTCLLAGAEKLQRAVEEAQQDEDPQLAEVIASMAPLLSSCGSLLEEAGYTILRREAPGVTGQKMQQAGICLQQLADILPQLKEGDDNAILSGQRLTYAAQQMTLAGDQLQGKVQPKSGKSWLKGGM